MNNDLISREAAIRAIRRKCIFAHIPFKSASHVIQRTLEALNAVREVPAVEAVPMVHSRWMHENGIAPAFKCMECRRCNFAPTPYCPNCGAKMDEEAPNDQ